jgi:hypothetical protein
VYSVDSCRTGLLLLWMEVAYSFTQVTNINQSSLNPMSNSNKSLCIISKLGLVL